MSQGSDKQVPKRMRRAGPEEYENMLFGEEQGNQGFMVDEQVQGPNIFPNAAAAAAPPNLAPNQGQVDRLTNLLNNIIEGQEDETIPPEVGAQDQRRLVTELMAEIERLINAKAEQQQARQQRLRDQQQALMSEAEAEMILQENAQLMNGINRILAGSLARLPRSERLRLNQRILTLISDTVTTHEVNQQLTSEPALSNIQSLFNALITYYTEMASYGYQHAPNILARIGSVVAGTAIIGSTIYTPSTISRTSGSILILLSSYLQSATTTSVGLYFLQRGGLPVQEMMEGIGNQTINCLRTGCNIVASEMTRVWQNSLIALQAYVTEDYENLILDWDSDTQSIITRPRLATISTTSSTISTAQSAQTAIEGILDVPDENLLDLLVNNNNPVPNEINGEEINVNSQLTNSQPDQELTDIDGGKKRKSRRHGKTKKTKKSKKSSKGKTVKRKAKKSIKKKQKKSKTLKKH